MSSAPVAVPLTRNCTPTTPTLSEAFALSATVPETVAPAGRRSHRNRRRSGIGDCIIYRDGDGRACGLIPCSITGSGARAYRSRSPIAAVFQFTE